MGRAALGRGVLVNGSGHEVGTVTYRNDWPKLLIAEIKPGKKLQTAVWTGAASSHSTPFAYGEVVELQVNGTALTRRLTLALCEANNNSYYHDFFGGILHVRIGANADPDAYISPDYTYNIVAFIWKGIANRGGVVFIPEDCTYPIQYDPTLKANSLSQLTATIADHFESAMESSFGGLSITNAEGWWYAGIDDWFWNNKDLRVRIGEVGDTYAALEKIFIGKVRNPVISDDAVNFEIVDNREGQLQSIPPLHYDVATYANLNVDAIGRPIPVLFGQKTNITPVCIDTVNYIFKISQTHFGAAVFEMQAVDAVYFKGAALSLTTHYTVDLHNGEITLTFAPADGIITVDAKGIKGQFNMATGAATGVYSENVADHWFFVLNVLNSIPVAKINLLSFSELQAARTQAVAWYLDEDTPTIDFNRLLQQTSLYHFLPLADGTFAARYYRKTVPVGTLELRNFDHKDFKKSKPSEGVFRDINLKYAKDPTTGLWKTLVHTQASTEQDHGTKEPFVAGTALRDDAEAAAVLAFYVALLKDPPTKIDTSISLIGAGMLPTDKIYNNRDIVADGKAITIDTDAVYVILQTRKNFADGRVGLTAQLDTQLAIYTVHADSAHQDVAHADHSDTVHNDAAHSNHTDNVPHADIAHVDSVHVDASYTDHDDHADGVPPYGDEPPPYSDNYHSDHSDNTHIDIAHADSAHVDTPYSDEPHEDSAHSDHTDTLHTDSHTDVSHIDSEV
jgi:hypothetical protein